MSGEYKLGSEMIHTCAILFALMPPETKFGPEAVWHPDAGFRKSVISACQGRGAGFMKCFAEHMRAAGASSQALAFTQAIQNNGYMGESRLVFGYSRPWEKNALPQKRLKILVRVQRKPAPYETSTCAY